MSEYEYKKVEGMTVGQVIDAMLEGKEFYTKSTYGGYDGKTRKLEVSNLYTWQKINDDSELYTRTEKSWWEGYEGSVIMGRHENHEEWRADTFECYEIHEGEYLFKCSGDFYKQARPLTSAERDAIKVKAL